ncbi:hypothetical protein SAMN06269250_5114 [Spirosoma fluviale]|uniref:Uncharacterized protein n=1 Tax=Spirosoma fluviale TaxID=1597977 RepID=A0A286GKJ2_9BACT|nr:hypothetical protein [Spirosoma fluviale]SOD96055.1 hypothetical protein SAMN06269250_5114 [Spirosoma fluviale]
MRTWKVWLVIVILLAVSPELMAQCAMCRGTVESTVSNGRSVVASNLNLGIVYLLMIPYLIVVSIAYLWYRNSKREYGRRLEIAGRVKRAMS